jgi:spore germination protein KA
MVTAITAISSYVIPSIGEATPILRLSLVFLSGALGLYGIMLGISIGIIHLCSLRSLGVPYLSPFAPITLLDLKDSVFVRAPIWTMITRPRVISRYNRKRQRLFQMPRPSKNK